MRTRLAILIFLAAFAPAYSQSASAPKAELPCKFIDYRITDKSTLNLYCSGARISEGSKTTDDPNEAGLADLMARYDLYNFHARASLYELNDDSAVLPAIEDSPSPVRPVSGSRFWLQITFNKLRGGADFEVRLTGTFTLYLNGKDDPKTYEFPTTRFRFTTKPDLAVTKTKLQTQDLFGHICLTQTGTLTDRTNNKTYTMSSPPCTDLDHMGRIRLKDSNGQQPAQLSQRLELSGVKDVFDQAPGVKAAKPAPPPAPPKNKEVATWYFNFLHQAGVGGKPTWITQVKIAPVFGILPARFFLVPSLDADIGQGQVGTVKTNDLINPKLAVSRLVWTRAGIWEAVRFNPALSYETNRKRDKRNLLFDGDAKFYFRGTMNTQAQRTKDRFLRAQLENPDKKLIPEDVGKAFFGYTLQFFLGTELGSSLTDNTVKSSDKSSQVLVPKYDINRLRPRFSANFEFGRFSAVISLTGRYLFSNENVTRELDTLSAGGKTSKTILLSTVSGWRGYGEFTFNYSLDPAGHYAINAVYKRGSQPPNFDRVNTVQSGVLVRF